MSTTATKPALLTAADAAERLGITERTFNRRLADGSIPDAIRHQLTFGQTKHRRYSSLALEQFIATGHVDSPP